MKSGDGEAASRREEETRREEEEGRGAVGRKRRAVSINTGAGRPATEGAAPTGGRGTRAGVKAAAAQLPLVVLCYEGRLRSINGCRRIFPDADSSREYFYSFLVSFFFYFSTIKSRNLPYLLLPLGP